MGAVRRGSARIFWWFKRPLLHVDKAMAEMSTQVQAQFNDVTAALEDKLTAVVDATGASAIYTLKTGEFE